MAELMAYATDCRVFGQVELEGGRMTELLNGAAGLRIRSARLEGLEGDRVIEVPELEVGHDEICAVIATGPRGDPDRRLRTWATRVQVDLGPYRIEGAVHGMRARDPITTALRRPAWVPLTDATIRYEAGSGPVMDDVPTLIVNRDLATSFHEIQEVLVPLPWETPRTAVPTPRALDLAGPDLEGRDSRDDYLDATIQALTQPTLPEARA